MSVVGRHAKNDGREMVVRDGGGGDLDTAGVERVLQSLQRCT